MSRARRQRLRPVPRRERGIALLVAILLVALGTIIAAAVAYENAMTARRGVSTFAFDQALLIGEGAEALAAYGLRQIKQTPQSNPRGQQTSSGDIYIGQGWDKPFGPLEVVPGVMLEASLEDLQGRFNVNNLVNQQMRPDPVQVAAFNNLLQMLGLETRWTGYLIDWIDGDLTPNNPDGAEDSVYMGQTPPYRTANRYITSISELLALPGFGRERYLKLAPYITALPYGTRINVCTASPVVLDAFVGPGHRDFSSDPEQFAKTRTAASGCSPTLNDYAVAFEKSAWQGLNGQGVSRAFGQTSTYFRLTSFITIGSAEFNLYSLLFQDGTGVRAIQRSFTPD
jgi:general secretion pathway protein K